MNLIDLIFPYDYIILIIVLLITLFSVFKGFIHSILSLMTWIGSILITLYSYNSLSDFLNNQLLKIEFLQNFESISSVVSILIAIPLIFLISLFVLKRVRKILSADLDKQILGLIFDRLLGLFYGLIFSYFIFSTILFFLTKFNLDNLSFWLIDNSEILKIINDINNDYIFNIIPNNEEL